MFTGSRLTFARLIVPSSGLLALHAEACRLSLPYLTGEPFAHSLPGQWTPHATLGRRFTAAEIGTALALTDSSDLSARLVGLRRWDGDERMDHQLVG